jgi:hypothetical protein
VFRKGWYKPHRGMEAEDLKTGKPVKKIDLADKDGPSLK